MIFGTVRVSLNWVECLQRSVIVLVGPERKLNVDLTGIWKKLLNAMSDFELKNYSWAFWWKKNFSTVKDLFNWIEILLRSVIVKVGSERELIIDLSGLWKKYLIRCQISSAKIIPVRFHEKWFLVHSRSCPFELRVYVGVS